MIIVENLFDGDHVEGVLKFIEVKPEDLTPNLWLVKGGTKHKVYQPRAGGEYRSLIANGYVPIKPIIVSYTERILPGDKYHILGEIKTADDDINLNEALIGEKILATSEDMSQNQINMITLGRLRHNDEVVIECEVDYTPPQNYPQKHPSRFNKIKSPLVFHYTGITYIGLIKKTNEIYTIGCQPTKDVDKLKNWKTDMLSCDDIEECRIFEIKEVR